MSTENIAELLRLFLQNEINAIKFQVKWCFPEKELKSVRSLDELAGLLKSYLRELPNPVIPFNVYDDMIAMAKKSNPTDDEIDCVVQKIPLPHRYALSHILEHIGRIHDFLGASHKLSTLFAAFGTILIRPPVTSVK